MGTGIGGENPTAYRATGARPRGGLGAADGRRHILKGLIRGDRSPRLGWRGRRAPRKKLQPTSKYSTRARPPQGVFWRQARFERRDLRASGAMRPRRRAATRSLGLLFAHSMDPERAEEGHPIQVPGPQLASGRRGAIAQAVREFASEGWQRDPHLGIREIDLVLLVDRQRGKELHEPISLLGAGPRPR